jgi:hypothetical protein
MTDVPQIRRRELSGRKATIASMSHDGGVENHNVGKSESLVVFRRITSLHDSKAKVDLRWTDKRLYERRFRCRKSKDESHFQD